MNSTIEFFHVSRFCLFVSLATSSVTFACGSGGSTGNGNGASGSSPGTGGGSGNPVAQADFATAFASAICDAIGPCCASSGYSYDRVTCTSTAASQAMALVGTINPATQAYNETAAGECIAGLSPVFRGCALKSLGNPFPASCKHIIVGKVALGASCTNERDCALPSDSSVRCATPVGTTGGSGKCVALPEVLRGKSDDTCNETCTDTPGSTSCASSGSPSTGAAGGQDAALGRCFTNDGLHCASTSKCSPLPAVNAPCPQGYCAPGAYCNAGTCEPQLATGACASDEACVTSARCDRAASKCSPKFADGAVCTAASDCLNAGCNNGHCGTPTAASSRTCAGDLD